MAPGRAIFAHGLNQNPYISSEQARVNEGDVITLHPFHDDPETITRSSKSCVDLRSIGMAATTSNNQISTPPLLKRSRNVSSSADLPGVPNYILFNATSHAPSFRRYKKTSGSFRFDQHDGPEFHETEGEINGSISTLLRIDGIEQLNLEPEKGLPKLSGLSSAKSEDKRNGLVINFALDVASSCGHTLHRTESIYELEPNTVKVSRSHNRKSSAPSIPEKSTRRLSDRSSSKYSSPQKTINKHARRSSSTSKVHRGIPPVSRGSLPRQPASHAADPYVINQKIAEMQAATARLKGPAPKSSNTIASISGNSEDNMRMLGRARTTYKRFSNFITRKPDLKELAGSSVTPFDRRLNESQNFGDSSRKLSQLTNSCKIPRKPLPNEVTSLRSRQSNENASQTFAGNSLGPRRATENFELAIARGDLAFLSEDDMEDDLIEEEPAFEKSRSKSKRHSLLRTFTDLASNKKRHSSAPTCRSVGTILSMSPDGESTPKLRMEPRLEAFYMKGHREVLVQSLDGGVLIDGTKDHGDVPTASFDDNFPINEKRLSKASLTSLEIDEAYVPYCGTRARRPPHLLNVPLAFRTGEWTKFQYRPKQKEMNIGQEVFATDGAELEIASPFLVRRDRSTLPKLIIPTYSLRPQRHDVRRKQVLSRANAAKYGSHNCGSRAEGATSNRFSIRSEYSLDEAVADDIRIAQQLAEELQAESVDMNKEEGGNCDPGE